MVESRRVNFNASWPRARKNPLPIGLSGLLGMLLAFMLTVPSAGSAKDRNPPLTPEGAKAAVKQIGVGKEVKVRFTSGKLLRGRLSGIGNDSFSIRTSKHAFETPIRYDEVAHIKDPGPLTWILVGAAIAVIVIVIVH